MKKFILIITTIFSVTISISSVLAAGADTTAGIKQFNGKSYRQALAYFDAAIRANPLDEVALYYKAITHVELGELAEARGAYEQTIDRCKGSREAKLAEAGIKQLDARATTNAPVATSNGVVAYGTPGRKTAPVESVVPTNSHLAPQPSRANQDTLPESCSVPFVINTTHRPELTALINGKPILTEFDTGANHFVLPISFAKDAGISLPPLGAPDAEYKKTGQKIWKMRADVKVGTIERKNCPILVFEDGPWPSAVLLGTDFFTDYSMSENDGTQLLTFERERGPELRTSAFGAVPQTYNNYNEIKIPLEKYPGKGALISAKINGVPAKILFDTGATSGLSITYEMLDKYNIPVDRMSKVYASNNRHYQTTYTSIEIGKFEDTRVTSYVNNANEITWGSDYPIVGTELFRNQGYKFKIDNDQGFLILEKAF